MRESPLANDGAKTAGPQGLAARHAGVCGGSESEAGEAYDVRKLCQARRIVAWGYGRRGERNCEMP